MPSSPSQKKHRAVIDVERKVLRDQYFNVGPEKPSHKQLWEWFNEKFYHTSSQSTISKLFSARFAYLSTESPLREKQKRQRLPL